MGQDISFSENQLKIGQRLIVKLWNAFQFIAGHGVYDLHEHIKPSDAVNQWLLHSLSICFAEYKEQLEMNEFSLALDRLERFFWNDFCDNYLEIIKDQLFNPTHYDAQQVQATRWTLSIVGFHILQLYAPYVPYVTESLYQRLYKNLFDKKSIHLTQFPMQLYHYPDSAKTMEMVISVISQVRKLKAEHKLSLKVPLKELVIFASDQQKLNTLKSLEKIIKGISQAEVIRYTIGKEKSLLQKIDEQWTGKLGLE